MHILAVVCLMLPALATAAEHPVLTFEDPAGDDDGNGSLLYPQRSGFEKGDLDLRSLRMLDLGASYRFEATFTNPIRDPATQLSDSGPESLAQFARRGFYAFNLDIYIDQDRVQGAGNTHTLPGRHVEIDQAHAWEKALVLTPRPELMRKQLVDAIAESEQIETAAAAQRVDRAILFPTAIKVRGRTISFEVPAHFLAGGRPKQEWSITAFMTGAKTSIEADLALLRSAQSTIAQLDLGVMQPQSGRPRTSFGYSSATAPSPIVDLLAPPPLNQQALLAVPITLPGVIGPHGGSAEIGPGAPAPGLGREQAAPEVSSKETRRSSTDAVAERLRTLRDLHQQGLISADEYRDLRRKILSEL